MRKGNKVLAALLTVCVLSGSLIACGNDNSQTSGSNETSKVTSSESKPSSKQEKVKITYSMWGSADEGKVTQELANKFNASQEIGRASCRERVLRLV